MKTNTKQLIYDYDGFTIHIIDNGFSVYNPIKLETRECKKYSDALVYINSHY